MSKNNKETQTTQKRVSKSKLFGILGLALGGAALVTGVSLSAYACATKGTGGGGGGGGDTPIPTPTPTTKFKINGSGDEGIKSLKFLVNGAEVTEAKAGTEVTVVVSENEDYALESLTYNGVDILAAKKFNMPNGDCNVFAKTTSTVVYITLELNGGTTTGQTKIKLAKGSYFGYAQLPVVTKENCTEGEWYFDEELTEPVLAGSVMNESITIYKNWFTKPALNPDCTSIHANADSKLSIAYEDIPVESSNTSANDVPSYNKGNIDIATIQYSTDGSNWTDYPAGSAIQFTKGSNIYLKAKRNPFYSGGQSFTHFKFTGDVALGGNVMGLLDDGKGEGTFAGERWFYGLFKDNTAITSIAKDYLPATTVGKQAYERMFYGCTNLQIAPELPASTVNTCSYYEMFSNCINLYSGPSQIGTSDTQMGYATCTKMFYGCTKLLLTPTLPATQTGEYCYQEMFEGCESLTSLPDSLPAQTAANSCYDRMFAGCKNITQVSTNFLPANTVGQFSYNQMFEECTSLKNAPKLPAMTISQDCYTKMFNKCESLEDLPENMLPATTLAEGCYDAMFQYCTSLKIAPALPAQDLTNAYYCYNNMFYYSGIVEAPALPATTLVQGCYNAMFAFCHNLVDAPALPAASLQYECYKYMFYECTSLETASIGPETGPLAPIGYGNYFAQMFERCHSLKQIKLRFNRNIDEYNYLQWLDNVNENAVLYYDGDSSYLNSNCIPRTLTIKPYSEANVFIKTHLYDEINGEITNKYLTPFVGRYTEQEYHKAYKTKYGRTRQTKVVVQKEGTTIGDVYATLKDNYVFLPENGCYLDKIQYKIDSGEWTDADFSVTTPITDNTEFRGIFKPTLIITQTWEQLATDINVIYTATDQSDLEQKITDFINKYKDTQHGFKPDDLDGFIGIKRDVTINNQIHEVVISNQLWDSLADTSKFVKSAVFTFKFDNAISDQNGYCLGTTYNGAGSEDSTNLDYINSDLRKATDGQGNGTIRWYRMKGTAPTEETAYKDKSVFDMLSESNTWVNNLKEVKKDVNIGTRTGTGSINWTMTRYNTKLFNPSKNDISMSYAIQQGVSSYIQRQTAGNDGSITEITWAQGVEGGETVANIAGLNYDNDLWYGTSYWLSSPYTGTPEGEKAKKDNCAEIIDITGNPSYAICYHWAMAIVPWFCI